MKVLTGEVIGAKGGEDGYVDVNLDNNGQTVRCYYGNGMVQVGTKATIISDDMDNLFLVGTSHNGMDEVISIMLDLMQKLIEQNAILASMKTVDTHPKAPGNWAHDKVGDINGVKGEIEALKGRLSKFFFR